MPSSTPTPALDPQLAIGEHLVTQEGLAIALASNVLQTQLRLVQSALDGSSGSRCSVLTGGGSVRVTGRKTAGAVTRLTDHIYYDRQCAKPYLNQPATVTQKSGGSVLVAKAKAAYTALDGTPLGSLATSAHADLGGSGIELEGLGTFTAPDGTVSASLGLACQSTSDTVLNCQGGVSQDFATLGQALGSVTPLRLTIGADPKDEISFRGTKNSTTVSAPGSLSITSPDHVHLAVHGGTASTSTIATKGMAGGFVLFPPKPTGWTVVDRAHDVKFSIDVTDDDSRELAGSVVQISTKKKLATLAVDRSGTGTITYDGQAPSPITSWLLAG